MPYRHNNNKKKRSHLTFTCSLVEQKKAKLGGLLSPAALLERLLSCPWASSGVLRLAKIFPGFIAHGCLREIIFQLRKKKKRKKDFCSRGSAISRRIFPPKSAWDCLEKGESEGGLTKFRVPRLACLLGGSPTGRPCPEQQRGCHLRLSQLLYFNYYYFFKGEWGFASDVT